MISNEPCIGNTCEHDFFLILDSQDFLAHRRRHTEPRFVSNAGASVHSFSFMEVFNFTGIFVDSRVGVHLSSTVL